MNNAMDRMWKQAAMPQPEIISRNLSVWNGSNHTRNVVSICGLWTNIWNGTSHVRRRTEKDWNGTAGKARAERENEVQVRIFGNNRKKEKKKEKKKKKKKKRLHNEKLRDFGGSLRVFLVSLNKGT